LSTTSNDLANRITPSTNEEAEDDFSIQENDLDNAAGDGGNGIKPTEHADKSFAGMFSTHLKEKEAQSARNSKETRLQRGRWREISDSMTYKERQEYFKEMHKEVDEKALMSTQPERLAKIERKRKDREWKENSQVIQGIFRKKAKLLPKEKKHVGQILDEKFPITETTGETKDKSVSQITHLKYIPPRMRAFTDKEKRGRRKAGLKNQGYEMHVSAYYQGLTFDKKGKQHMVDELNHMWVRDVFAEPFLTLVKKIGKEETEGDVSVLHRKWIPVPVGECSNNEVTRDLVAGVRVRYQQGDVKTCLFRSLASAFHHLGRKHTGSVLASRAKELCNLPAEEQVQEAIKIVLKYDKVYKKVDYWKKEAVIAKHDFLGEPNDNPKLFVLRGNDGGVHHAISVVGRIIFDSNLGQCLTLSKASFDWCCGCDGGFNKVHKVLQFRIKGT
jgi:hypothetical protein